VNQDELRSLIRLVEESEIDELEIRRWGHTVRIVKNGTRTAVVGPLPPGVLEADSAGARDRAPTSEDSATGAPAETVSELHEVKSPMVGTFYRAPSPEAPPFVDVGDRVRPGQTLCILEAMKLMNELQAEVSGIVRQVRVGNGEPVEYGQPLFDIELA
jgi:acetyl-CoA carboxylase biotin carboxyl carrier protein